MGRAALVVLCVCAWCGGCENTPFYHATTKDWLGPYPATSAPAPRMGDNSPPATAKPG